MGAEAIRLAMLHDQRVRDPRGTRATDAMTVSSLGAELERADRVKELDSKVSLSLSLFFEKDPLILAGTS